MRYADYAIAYAIACSHITGIPKQLVLIWYRHHSAFWAKSNSANWRKMLQ